MIRITNASIYEHLSASIAERTSVVNEHRVRISTGQKVRDYSAEPSAVREVLRQRNALREIEAGRESADRAEHLLLSSEDALMETTNSLYRVKELAVQFASDTYTAADRATAAAEVRQIRGRILETVNRNEQGRYLFGGLGSAQAPFDATGAFVGDTGVLEIPLARGASIQASLPGGEPLTDPGGGPSVFDTLNDLETALEADDPAGIAATIDETITHVARVSRGIERIGYRMQRIESYRSGMDSAEDMASSLLSSAQDADLAQAVMDLKEAEVGMQAAMALTARVDQLSLLNFLN